MNQTTSKNEMIIITVQRGDETKVVSFCNDRYGQTKSVRYCNDLLKEHLKHPFNRLMAYADKKNDTNAKNFLKEQPFEKPPSLSINTRVLDKETFEIMYS